MKRRIGTCLLCGEKLGKDFYEGLLNKELIAELRGERFAGSLKSTNGKIHHSCLHALPVPVQRKVIQNDWQYKILNTDLEVWVKEDEYGRLLWKTLASETPEIDARIQKLKQQKEWSEKDKEWLKELINFA